MSTENLIRDLVADAVPVRRLRHPLARLAIWLVPTLMVALAVVAFFGPRDDLSMRLGEARFVTEVVAAFATGILAALAALSSSYPGRSRWEFLLPLPALAIWLGSLGEGCWRTFMRFGPDGVLLMPDLVCFPAILMVATLPAILLFRMIRHGAPLVPRVSLGLMALAASAVGAAALRLFHPQDASVMVLVWQFGTVALLTFFGALTGGSLLAWPARVAARSTAKRSARRMDQS